MTEQELRELVRESIARHTGRESAAMPSRAHDHAHVSHARFVVLQSGDTDGACLIEPAVRCNHCGYCLSYGH